MSDFDGFTTETGLPTGDNRRIKTCTVIKVEDGKLMEILDFSLVDDDHKFGMYEDGYIHVEGHIEIKYIE